jgi:hypothetical protein
MKIIFSSAIQPYFRFSFPFSTRICFLSLYVCKPIKKLGDRETQIDVICLDIYSSEATNLKKKLFWSSQTLVKVMFYKKK